MCLHTYFGINSHLEKNKEKIINFICYTKKKKTTKNTAKKDRRVFFSVYCFLWTHVRLKAVNLVYTLNTHTNTQCIVVTRV